MSVVLLIGSAYVMFIAFNLFLKQDLSKVSKVMYENLDKSDTKIFCKLNAIGMFIGAIGCLITSILSLFIFKFYIYIPLIVGVLVYMIVATVAQNKYNKEEEKQEFDHRLF